MAVACGESDWSEGALPEEVPTACPSLPRLSLHMQSLSFVCREDPFLLRAPLTQNEAGAARKWPTNPSSSFPFPQSPAQLCLMVVQGRDLGLLSLRQVSTAAGALVCHRARRPQSKPPSPPAGVKLPKRRSSADTLFSLSLPLSLCLSGWRVSLQPLSVRDGPGLEMLCLPAQCTSQATVMLVQVPDGQRQWSGRWDKQI